jgi:hypothetical protein
MRDQCYMNFCRTLLPNPCHPLEDGNPERRSVYGNTHCCHSRPRLCRKFGQHAVRLRNGTGLQASARPARGNPVRRRVSLPVIPAKAGIQSDGVSPVMQLFGLFEETSRDWPRRATCFFASPKKEAKKATAKSLPLRGSRGSDAPSGKRNKLAFGSDKFRFFIR